MKPGFKSLVVAGLLATAGLAAYSQPSDAGCGYGYGSMMGGGYQQGGRQWGPHGGRMDPARIDAYVAKRSADLKAKLKITAAQESAWTAYTAAMKPPATVLDKRPDRAELDKLSTPERIDKMRSLRTQQLADMNAALDQRDEATKTLYAALSAEQKKVFDTEHNRMGRRFGERRWSAPDTTGDKPAKK
ncbi:MAG: Spy/CpxP family protein refolding chaperone [Rhodoferax sp.]